METFLSSILPAVAAVVTASFIIIKYRQFLNADIHTINLGNFSTVIIFNKFLIKKVGRKSKYVTGRLDNYRSNMLIKVGDSSDFVFVKMNALSATPKDIEIAMHILDSASMEKVLSN